MHRFNPERRQAFVEMMQQRNLFASISVGVKDEEFDFIEALAAANLTPEYITIDIAHGHAQIVIDMIHHIKHYLPTPLLSLVTSALPKACGNSKTLVRMPPRLVSALVRSASPRLNRFGTGGWQLAALRWCAKAARKPIITDGGIRTHGDIAKSIRFGATMCMIGSLFAGHEETPGKKVDVDGVRYQEYFGSASEYQKGAHRNVEGKNVDAC